MASENAAFDALASQAHEAMIPRKKTLLGDLAAQITAVPAVDSWTDQELENRFPGWGENKLHEFVSRMNNLVKTSTLSLKDEGEKIANTRDMAQAQLRRLKSKAWLATVRPISA